MEEVKSHEANWLDETARSIIDDSVVEVKLYEAIATNF